MSVAVTAKFTFAPSWPDGAATVRLVGYVRVGASVSVTVTVKEQLAEPATFEAVHMTVEAPTGNKWGETSRFVPSLHVTAGVGLPVTGVANDTAPKQRPGAFRIVRLPGHVMVGGVFVALALTVTVKAQALLFPVASVARQVTTVAPKGKAEPEAGEQVTDTPEQLSVTVGEGKLRIKLVCPAAVLATTLDGQVFAGG